MRNRNETGIENRYRRAGKTSCAVMKCVDLVTLERNVSFPNHLLLESLNKLHTDRLHTEGRIASEYSRTVETQQARLGWLTRRRQAAMSRPKSSGLLGMAAR